jgi:hypothetical protein
LLWILLTCFNDQQHFFCCIEVFKDWVKAERIRGADLYRDTKRSQNCPSL